MLVESIQNTNKVQHQLAHTSPNHMANQMTKAIKDYKDEFFTGLTDDERKAIEEEVFAYAKEHAVNGKIDRTELKNLITKRLSEYGYKGNLSEAILGFLNTVCDEKGNIKESTPVSSSDPQAAQTAYGLSEADALAIKEQLLFNKASQDNDSDEQVVPLEALQDPKQAKSSAITTKTITHPDGSKTIVVLRGTQIIHQFKVIKGDTLTKEQQDVLLFSK